MSSLAPFGFNARSKERAFFLSAGLGIHTYPGVTFRPHLIRTVDVRFGVFPRLSAAEAIATYGSFFNWMSLNWTVMGSPLCICSAITPDFGATAGSASVTSAVSTPFT